jgi:hypothetical protein
LSTDRKPFYSLAELLSGMQPGDMPIDRAWDIAPAVGEECGALGSKRIADFVPKEGVEITTTLSGSIADDTGHLDV